MFDKVFIAIILLGGVAMAIYLNTPGMKENFWDIPSRQWKAEKVLSRDVRIGSEADPDRTDFFQSPNFQSILSPRFSNVNYGPYLRTALPPYNMTGVPKDPLMSGPPVPVPLVPIKPPGVAHAETYQWNKQMDDVRSDDAVMYATGNGGSLASGRPFSAYGGDQVPICPCGSAGCGGACGATPISYGVSQPVLPGAQFRPGIPLDPRNATSADYANGNYKTAVADVMTRGGGPIPTSQIMLGTAEVPFMGIDGELMQPIIYDRYIYANRRSRLRSQGDPIRGDLPIVPLTGQWFVPSVSPNLDLQAGAIGVMAGFNNETSQQLANLIYNSSGGAETVHAGQDLSQVNMSHQVLGSTRAAQSDINLKAFP